jgi:hypothetical protein
MNVITTFITRRRPLAIGIAVIVLFALWAAFRPELLFVNKSVDEPFPTSSKTSYQLAPVAHVARIENASLRFRVGA